MTPVLLMLEDDSERLERFRVAAEQLGVEIISWPDAHVMVAEMGQFLPVAFLISLDHDLEPTGPDDPGDGLQVTKQLATLSPLCPVVIHTSNGARGDWMEGELDLAGWTYHRIAPLGDDWIEVDWFRIVKRALRMHRPPE
jgi:hypothetical protein